VIFLDIILVLYYYNKTVAKEIAHHTDGRFNFSEETKVPDSFFILQATGNPKT
jgi:hypothetical protein